MLFFKHTRLRGLPLIMAAVAVGATPAAAQEQGNRNFEGVWKIALRLSETI